jgi:hypothetical protein
MYRINDYTTNIEQKTNIMQDNCLFFVCNMKHNVLDICRMANKVHRGEIVEAAIRQSGISFTDVAKAIGYNRSYLYTLWDNPDLSYDIIIKVGKAIKHDFRPDFQDMYLMDSNEVKEPSADYHNQSELLKQCMKEKKEWKDKYISLMEEHTAILRDKLNKQ